MKLHWQILISSAISAADGFSMLPGPTSSGPTALRMATKEAPHVNDPSQIRNVALVGHSHAGKTSLAEWMLYKENIITQKPVGGESSLDSDPIEAIRHSSIFSHFMRIPHHNYLLEITDTPFGDFPSDALAALDGADSAVLLVSGPDGVQAGTLNAFQHCQEAGINSVIAISKMDRPFITIDSVLSDIETKMGVNAVPLQICKYNEKGAFEGVDSIFKLNKEGNVQKNEAPELNDLWTTLEESVAMTNDDLLVDYLENSELQFDELLSGLREAVRQRKIVPLVYLSAEHDMGVSELMDTIAAVLPDPVETREETLKVACENDEESCELTPGVEIGFAARILHTTVDAFGSLSILRVISNSRNEEKDGEGLFHSFPAEVMNLRTQEIVKMPSASASFGLCGKHRQALSDASHILPGDVVAVPKMPDQIKTNDIICIPSAVTKEENEIEIEKSSLSLSPLSRVTEEIPLMASATICLTSSGGKKGGKGKQGGGVDDKLVQALTAMSREDLALQVGTESGALVVHCMSQDHLKLVTSRLQDRYKIEVELGKPSIQYRETLVKTVSKIEGRHKKQSGGSGQFGVCYIDMEPLEEGSGIEFESKIKGGAISKTFINSVEKGVYEELKSGGLLGYPVTDVKVTLVDGKMHSVDSKDIAFQSAARQAIKAALAKGKTRLLQPMEKVTFVVNESFQGEISSIVSRKDGYVTASSSSGNDLAEIDAIIPSSTISEVSEILRAESAGEGTYTSVFSHYQPVPDTQVKILTDLSP